MLSAVVIIGGVSVATAAGIFAVLHLLRYLPAAVGVLIGLHLLPLAGVFRQQVYRVFASLLIAWSAACLLLDTRVGLFSAIGVVVLLCALALTLRARTRRPAILRALEEEAVPVPQTEAADVALQREP